MDFRITADGNERDIREIHEMLKKYNLAHREASQSVPIGIFLEDEMGRKLAGLTGETFGNWLCTRYLFVSESLRGQGIGGRLLETAELDAKRRSATSSVPSMPASGRRALIPVPTARKWTDVRCLGALLPTIRRRWSA